MSTFIYLIINIIMSGDIFLIFLLFLCVLIGSVKGLFLLSLFKRNSKKKKCSFKLTANMHWKDRCWWGSNLSSADLCSFLAMNGKSGLHIFQYAIHVESSGFVSFLHYLLHCSFQHEIFTYHGKLEPISHLHQHSLTNRQKGKVLDEWARHLGW